MDGERLRIKETQQLADAMFDRHINVQTLQRLEDLITTDLGCLQAYVERIGFHSDLMKQSAERSMERQAEAAMDRILFAQLSRERRQVWMFRMMVAACVGVVLAAGSWLAMAPRILPPKIGMIASLTEDVRPSSASLELGEVVRQGGTYSLEQGIVCLQLPQVTLDLVGPVTVRLRDATHLELQSGTVHAYVHRGGEGFTVHTPDSIIVDLGTEFLVEYLAEKGTEISVRRGRVQANLLDGNGNSRKLQDITTARSMVLSRRESLVREVDFIPEKFERVERSRGMVVSIDGNLRTITQFPPSLGSNQLPTPNHMLVIPERQRVVLKQELQITSLSGPVRLPAGSVVSSYLIHYDPNELTHMAPRGAATFDGRIAAVLVSSEQLSSTDEIFGLPETTYEPLKIRELELDEDEIRISDDRRTISFYFGASGGQPLDEARVLVIGETP